MCACVSVCVPDNMWFVSDPKSLSNVVTEHRSGALEAEAEV